MARIEKATIVGASIEEVFNYISEPGNLPAFWPSLMEINDVQSLPNGRYSGRWLYKMAGMLFDGIVEYTEVVPNHLLAIKTNHGINSKITQDDLKIKSTNFPASLQELRNLDC